MPSTAGGAGSHGPGAAILKSWQQQGQEKHARPRLSSGYGLEEPVGQQGRPRVFGCILPQGVVPVRSSCTSASIS